MLGEGGADQGDYALADQQVEGGDGAGFIGGAVFQLQAHGTAAWGALLGPALGHSQTHALVLAVEVGVAGESDGSPEGEGPGGERLGGRISAAAQPGEGADAGQ